MQWSPRVKLCFSDEELIQNLVSTHDRPERRTAGIRSAMPNRVYVIGVGMTKFEKPGSREGWDYPAMALEPGTKELVDAGTSSSSLFLFYCSSCNR